MDLTRRDTLKYGAAAAALFALPEWAVPALAEGEVDVPFTDYPDTFAANPANGERRFLDLRKVDGIGDARYEELKDLVTV